MFINYDRTVTIKIPNGSYVDGKPEYNEITPMAFRTEVSQFDLNLFGKVKISRIYLVDTTSEILSDSIIIDGNDKTTVAAAKPCRSVTGEIICMRVGSN